jgi:hypothetical protein
MGEVKKRVLRSLFPYSTKLPFAFRTSNRERPDRVTSILLLVAVAANLSKASFSLISCSSSAF